MESEVVIEEVPAVAVEAPPADPPDMEAVRAYFTAMQLDLAKRLSAIEQFFGFVESAEALGVRLAKLEAFVGIK